MKHFHIQEIPYVEPMSVVTHLPCDKDFIFFDSATKTSLVSRYSIIAYDPFSILSCREGYIEIDGNVSYEHPLIVLNQTLEQYSFPPSQLLPFIGGVAGYIGYEFINYIERRINLTKRNDQEFPDLILGIFDLVIAFDHVTKKSWIYSSGLPETNPTLRKIRAKNRCNKLLLILNSISLVPSEKKYQFISKNDIHCNISYEEYYSGIQKVLNYIQAGDIYQANIAQRFSCHLPQELSSLQIYQRLRTYNPAPFAAYLNLKGCIIASASPERFILLQERHVTTCPIKGTAPRSSDKNKDQKLAKDLATCQKNLAENLMIVDLMRNDLSRVCELFSVKASKLFSVESFATIHHLVSTIQGKLKHQYNAIDLMAAAFPGGSITGAPKIRAVEIIDEIESHARGPYCGCIGYIGFDGKMDTSILIRTFVIKDRLLTFHVGGGIVADSKPEDEFVETLIKADALYFALTGKKIHCVANTNL